jgi:tetratricopeptide (TPR) repeat protein
MSASDHTQDEASTQDSSSGEEAQPQAKASQTSSDQSSSTAKEDVSGPTSDTSEAPTPRDYEARRGYHSRARGRYRDDLPEDRGFFEDLAWRRVPHIMFGYMTGAWPFFKVMLWVCDRAQLPRQVADLTLATLIGLLPAVAFVAYRHGRSGLHAWGLLDVASLSTNLLVVAGGIAITTLEGPLLTEDEGPGERRAEASAPDKTVVRVATRPSGAEVLRDGDQSLGVTPLRHPLTEDTISLRIEKAGYVPLDTALRLHGEASDSLLISLKERAKRQPGSDRQPVAGGTSGGDRPLSSGLGSTEGLPASTDHSPDQASGETVSPQSELPPGRIGPALLFGARGVVVSQEGGPSIGQNIFGTGPESETASSLQHEAARGLGRGAEAAETGGDGQEGEESGAKALTESEKDQRAGKLLKDARRALEAGRLTKPASESAYDAVQEVLDLDPGNEEAQGLKSEIADQLLRRAGDAEESGNLRAAVSHLQASLDIRGDRDSTRKRLEDLRGQLKRQGEASRLLDRAWARLKSSPSIAALNEIIEAAKKAQALDEDTDEGRALLGEAWFKRGVALAEQGNLAEAIGSYDRALEVDSSRAATWYNRGLALYRQGNLPGAISSYDRALKIDPSLARAWLNRGFSLAKQGNHAEAIGSYDRALEVDSSLVEAWSRRGLALASQGNFAEAIGSFDRALKIDSSHAAAWYNRSLALQRQGKESKARKSLTRACELDPSSFEKCSSASGND